MVTSAHGVNSGAKVEVEVSGDQVKRVSMANSNLMNVMQEA